jgi:hypothetical protein
MKRVIKIFLVSIGTIFTIIIAVPVFLFLEFRANEHDFVKPWPAICNEDFNDTSKFAITCRIWGLLKYHHPNVTKGLVDWDAILISSLDRIMKTKTIEEINNELFNLIKSAGEIDIEIINNLRSKISVESILNVNLCWIKQSFLNDTIVSNLLQISFLSVELPSYYVRYKDDYALDFSNEKKYGKKCIDDYRYRLLSLFRYWNIIYYFFPYKYMMDIPWDKTLYDFIPKFLNNNDIIKYGLTIKELSTRINDGHASIIGYISNNYPPPHVKLSRINGNVYIRKMPSKSSLQQGDIIVEINNKNIEKLRDSLKKYQPSSHNLYTDYKINQSLGGMIETANSVTVYRKGEKIKFSSKIYSGLDYFERESYSDISSVYKEIMSQKNIGYINPVKISEPDVPGIMEQFHATNGIIIDIRCYPNNYVVYDLVLYFNNSLFFTDFAFARNNLVYPGSFIIRPHKHIYVNRLKHWLNVNKPEKYKGKLAVLADESTMSAAETATMYLKGNGVTVIGRPTAGANGNIARFLLPGDIEAQFSSIGMFYPDGSEIQRIGIIPDIEVYPTVESILEGKDEILEAAITYLQK